MRFGLVGSAGYIAKKHIGIIKELGHDLVCALDPSPNMGHLDVLGFPDCRFFQEFELFDRHLEKLRRRGEGIDYLVVCSPNYLHDAHCRAALRVDADAICEKPLVLSPWNVDQLEVLEEENARRVFPIMQLRHHPAVQELEAWVRDARPKEHIFGVNLTYVTRRGHWYDTVWKGDETKSGGVMANLGVHFFDVLLRVFGEVRCFQVTRRERRCAAGYLHLKRAAVKWTLSVDEDDLPEATREAGESAYRKLEMDGYEVDLSAGFQDLHKACYEEVLAGRGLTLADVRPVIDLLYRMRNAPVKPTGRD